MAQIEIDDKLLKRLKKMAAARALPSTAEKELARAVKLYLDKWEMFLVGNRR